VNNSYIPPNEDKRSRALVEPPWRLVLKRSLKIGGAAEVLKNWRCYRGV